MISKYNYKNIKQKVFLQQVSPLVFFHAGSNMISRTKNFITLMEQYFNVKFDVLKLKRSFFLKNISAHSFWYTGHVVCVRFKVLTAAFLDFLKSDAFKLGRFFFIGFKYDNSFYYNDNNGVLSVLLKTQFITEWPKIINIMHLFINKCIILINNLLIQIYNILYANIKSIIYWMSFRKEETA